MRKYYPNYSIGTDAYSDIPMVCEKYGTKAVIIGGKRALAAAADMIKEAVKDSKITIVVAEKRLILVKYCHRKATDHSLHFQRLLLLVLPAHPLVSSITQMVPFVNILFRKNLLNGSLSIHK